MVAPPQRHRKHPWSYPLRRWVTGKRPLVETAFAQLQGFFRLGPDRPHTLEGLQPRLEAKVARHNFCIGLNRQLGRPNPSFADLLGWQPPGYFTPIVQFAAAALAKSRCIRYLIPHTRHTPNSAQHPEAFMGWSSHHPTGLIHYNPQHSYRGYTLVATNRGGNYANLVDPEGRVCHRWYHPEGITYGYLLPNGNLLFRSQPPRPGSGETEIGGGQSRSLIELSWDGSVVWEYRSPELYLHHDFERLPNGNTLILLWTPMPADLTAQVQGGFRTDKDPEQMYGDVVQEITPEGAVVWQWNSWEFLDVTEDIICPLEGRKEWTHQNALNVTPEGDLLVSYRQTSTVGIVDKGSGAFRWKWGPGQVFHQHHPTWLNNGRVMLFDNGCHRRGAPSHSRIIEVDPETNEIGWEYQGTPNISFFSYNISSAERLPNGNTLICEGAPGRIFEVTPGGEIVWEYINPFFGESVNGGAPLNGVFRAHRYGPDHPALRHKDLDPARHANLNRLYAGD